MGNRTASWLVKGSLVLVVLFAGCGEVAAPPPSENRQVAVEMLAAPTIAPTTAPTIAPTLSSPTAEPTIVPTAAPSATPLPPIVAPTLAPIPNKPLAVEIPALGLWEAIVEVGVGADGQFEVPDHEVGWYNASARPGDAENVVLWGHVLRFRSTPQKAAPFERLHELAIGATIVMRSENGRQYNYIVEQQLRVLPTEVEYVLPSGDARLTLVSCIGERVLGGNGLDMSHRLITIARLVD